MQIHRRRQQLHEPTDHVTFASTVTVLEFRPKSQLLGVLQRRRTHRCRRWCRLLFLLLVLFLLVVVVVLVRG